MMEAFTRIYITTLIVIAVIAGIVNLFQLISFIKQSKSKFLSSRNPSLIILYCIIALLTAFITTPLVLYYRNLNTNSTFFAKFTTEFFNEFCHAMLYVIILCRSWLLYYDYKFSESSSNEIWRNIINPNDNDFWLQNRKTFGNLHFIICGSLIINTISLICLSFIGALALKQQKSNIFHYFTLFGLGIPFYSFIIYLILYKIKFINDVYLIHKELKYLSLCIMIRIIAFIIDLIINPYDQYLFSYTIEILSTFLMVWIQCRWVLNQLKKQENEQYLEKYHYLKQKEKTKDKNDDNKNSKPLLKMIDIFDDKTSFEIFIGHCIHELSVESVLFLIEVSQFKATLSRFNAVGISCIKYRCIDVINTNFIDYIKQIRQNKVNKEIKLHRYPSALILDNISSDHIAEYSSNRNNGNIPNNENKLYLSPSLIYDNNDEHSMNSMISNNSIQAPSEISIDHNISHQSSLNRLQSLYSSSPTSPTTNITSIKQENEYKQFQNTILNKKWLPIAMPLKLLSNNSNNNSNKMTSEKEKKEKNSKTETDRNDIDKLKLNGNNYINPISLEVIDDNKINNIDDDDDDNDDNDDDNDEKKEGNDVDINWIYEYGRHLYLKYCDNSADLAINIQYITRKNLWNVYNKELSIKAFEEMQLIHHDYLSQIQHLTLNEEILFIQTYLYHSFDIAFHSIWTLLTSDTFHRFQKTKQYEILCKQRDAIKLKNARIKRDTQYSQSFQGNEFNI